MINLSFADNKVFFLDIRRFSRGIDTPGIIDKLNQAMLSILGDILPENNIQNAILKVHIGEDANNTSMRPELLSSTVEVLKNKGCRAIGYGDTTVAYKGPRSYKENPENDPSKYLQKTKERGFNTIPFIILDRPVTSITGFKFDKVHEELTINDHRIRYKKIYLAGGFLNTDLLINNAHLTGHLLAKNAMCIKSIAMGLTSYAGNIQLHQNLYPDIDSEKCTQCEECVNECPEQALSLGEIAIELNKSICIGCAACATICPEEIIRMESKGISTWNKGTSSLDIRMAEYTIAMLSFFTGRMINIGHLYSITGMCDCMDTLQKPNCDDIGIVIGKNPFAVDFAGCTLEGLMKSGDRTSWDLKSLLAIASGSKRYEVYDYVRDTFDIDYIPDIERIEVV